MNQKTALVLGGGGFIGSHLVKQLKLEGYWVRAADLKLPLFSKSPADEFSLGDLRSAKFVSNVMFGPKQISLSDKINSFDEVYQLAADMGGAAYIFTGNNDANIMHNSASINLNVAEHAINFNVKNLFYSSSACIYPSYNQNDPKNPKCDEQSAYPAQPDSEYGWEKLFSERLFQSCFRNYGLNIKIARYHNIFGPEGTYEGGKEKAPAAICRKVALAKDGDSIEIWGSGDQTRSFLYIDECIEGTLKLMRSEIHEPLNIGSDEMISINDLTKMIIQISGKNLTINNIDGPVGVNGRNSDNALISKKLGWKPSKKLIDGITQTYRWIESRYNA